MSTILATSRTAGTSTPAARWWPFWLAAAAAHVAAALLLWSYTSDDTFILLRYSRNLAEGYGPLLNPGRTPVEGYTSPLWMVAVAAVYPLTENLEAAAKVGGLLLDLGSLALVALFLRDRLGARRPAALILPLGLVALSHHMVTAAVEGLETPALTFLMLWIAYLATASRLRAGGLAGLGVAQAAAYLVRPDAALIVAGLALLWLSGRLPPAPRRAADRWRSFPVVWGVVAGVGIVHLLWRQAYYGFWFPATFYAKKGGSPVHLALGGERLASFMLETVGIPLILLLLLLPLARRRRAGDAGVGAVGEALAVVWLMIGARVAFHLYSGGEVMGLDRFLTPTVPFFALLWGWAIERALAAAAVRPAAGAAGRPAGLGGGRAVRTAVLGAAALALLLEGIQLGPTRSDRLAYADFLRTNHGALGDWLEAEAGPDWLVAAGGVGLVFYRAERVDVLDLMGLNDYHIARLPGRWLPRGLSHKVDVDYVLDASPELVVLRGDPARGEGQRIEQALYAAPAFHERYRHRTDHGWLSVYARRDLVP